MTLIGGTPQLGLYDVAFLAGGPDRVIDTAVVALVESGRVRVHAPGELAVVDPGRQHPVEAAVMDAIGTRGHRSVATVRWRLAGDERLSELARGLAAGGLVRRRTRLSRRRRGERWVTTRSGREALRHVRQAPPSPALDGGAALRIALDGRGAMTDAALRRNIFERPARPLPPTSGMSRRLRDAALHDPAHADFRTQQAALGTEAGIGFAEGGPGDGGGF